MPSNVFERDGKWCARVTRQGRQVWLGTFGTEEEARAAARCASPVSQGTMGDWFLQWPAVAGMRRSRTEGSIAHTAALARPFVQAFGGRELDGVTRQEAALWALKHPATVRWARTILGDAVWAGVLLENPLAGVSPPMAAPERKRVLSEEEVIQIAGESEGRMLALVLICAYSGLRLSEGLALERRDLDGDVLHVRCGKGGKEGWSILFDPGLSAFVAAAPDVGRLFSQRWDRFAVGKMFRKACAAAGVEGATFHDLRHFHATWLYEQGCSEEDVAMQLRHSGLRSVRRYLHPSAPPHLDRVRQAVAS